MIKVVLGQRKRWKLFYEKIYRFTIKGEDENLYGTFLQLSVFNPYKLACD